jgi:hypothetical protein
MYKVVFMMSSFFAMTCYAESDVQEIMDWDLGSNAAQQIFKKDLSEILETSATTKKTKLDLMRKLIDENKVESIKNMLNTDLFSGNITRLDTRDIFELIEYSLSKSKLDSLLAILHAGRLDKNLCQKQIAHGLLMAVNKNDVSNAIHFLGLLHDDKILQGTLRKCLLLEIQDPKLKLKLGTHLDKIQGAIR